ncbi:MAG TPA: SGNH hydrolase domain-containing protein, partial [Solirubrobacteraceae bacterium]|nr:SGNH hydrolase domain-containing protein [Solirubrobacteraceae bacterium]
MVATWPKPRPRDPDLRSLAPLRTGAAVAVLLLTVVALARAAATPPPAGACTDGSGCGQPCYGAAARDPEHQPCLNPALELSVFPTPDAAELEVGDRCATKERSANWWVCGFGPVAGTRTFALIGDSHAGHWRGALANLAFGQGWRGISITRAGCPFSQAVPDLAPPLGAECAAWNRRVLRWFASHPQVDLVFVSEHSGAG